MDTLQTIAQLTFSFVGEVGECIKAKVAHSFKHVNCPACDAARDRTMVDPEKLRLLPFSAVAEQWLLSRVKHLKPRTYYGYGLHVKSLNAFFGPQIVHRIHIGHINEYQKGRQTNESGVWAQPANASYINHELVTFRGILERAGEWAKINPHYEALKMPKSRKAKTLTDAQEQLVFAVAARNPEWNMAYWAASITVNSGASGTELRHLQLKDLILEGPSPSFFINGDTAKNMGRERIAQLNPTALKQMKRCLERAVSLGAMSPEHYVFPFGLARNRWDVTRPTTDAWLRRSFGALREAVGLPWLTPHCFRHQHITLRIEAGEPIEVIAKGVGHAGIDMTRYYHGARAEPQRRGVDAIDPSKRFPAKAVTAPRLQQVG